MENLVLILELFLHKILHGGGTEIRKNRNNQYYYAKGSSDDGGVSKDGVIVSYVYGSDGIKGKPD